MSKKIAVELDSKELKQLSEKMYEWAEMMEKASKDIVSDLADFSFEKIQEIYNQAQQQYQDTSAMDFFITGSEKEKTVGMQGPQAIYDEFGTGTMGENSPHPAKNEFALNAYNSGPTIRAAKNDIITDAIQINAGELYWTYKDETGQTHFTQGIPAQKEVYDSLKATRKKAPEIIKKRMEETLKW